MRTSPTCVVSNSCFEVPLQRRVCSDCILLSRKSRARRCLGRSSHLCNRVDFGVVHAVTSDYDEIDLHCLRRVRRASRLLVEWFTCVQIAFPRDVAITCLLVESLDVLSSVLVVVRFVVDVQRLRETLETRFRHPETLTHPCPREHRGLSSTIQPLTTTFLP